MAVGIPSTQMIPPASTEAFQYKTKGGLLVNLAGPMYIQYAASAAYNTSVTETSILNNTVTTAQGTLSIPQQGLAYGPLNSIALAPGTVIRVKLVGTIGNTATPTLRIRTGLINQAGTVTTIADTTVLTMATITGVGYFEYTAEIVVGAYSASVGSMIGTSQLRYTTVAAPAQSAAMSFLQAAQIATSSFDTTQTYALDVKATWGTSSASNTITTGYAIVEMIS